MFDFILHGAGRFEQLKRSDVTIGVSEIETRYKEEWNGSEVAKRCQEKIAEPLKRALTGRTSPRLLFSAALEKNNRNFSAVELGDTPQTNEMIHLLQVGDQVFMIDAFEREHRRAELRIFPPIPAAELDLEKFKEGGVKEIWGETRSKLDQIRLFRDRPPTTGVQFNEGKVHDDESYAWALWETITSALRRGRTLALRELGELDALELKADGRARSKSEAPRSFDEVLPLLTRRTGRMIVDGPPGGHDLLHLLSWNQKTVAVTRERGEPSRIRAFIRDRIGDRPVWLELRFPKDAIVPTGGVAAAVKGNTLRIFGGLDADKQALDTEWQFDLVGGSRDAYATSTFKRGPSLPNAVAWATALATDTRTMIVGGVAGFFADKSDSDPSPRAQAIHHALEQARANGAEWATRRSASSKMLGAHVLVDGEAAFFGPDASFDGRLFYSDENIGFVELPNLPLRCGLGQLHAAGNLLIYTGGFTPGDPPEASTKMYTLDLELLDGWKPAGEVALLAGNNRLIAQDGRLVVLGMTPNHRFTFIPGEQEGA